jgi:hypothetical protein
LFGHPVAVRPRELPFVDNFPASTAGGTSFYSRLVPTYPTHMKKLFEHLNSILADDEVLELRELKLGFVRKEKEILRIIQLCKKSGGVIGIYSPVLGNGMFLCSVQQILQGKTLVLRPVDPNGKILSKTLIDLSEVTCICPFNQVYNHQHAVESEMDDEDSPSQLNIFQSAN